MICQHFPTNTFVEKERNGKSGKLLLAVIPLQYDGKREGTKLLLPFVCCCRLYSLKLNSNFDDP